MRASCLLLNNSFSSQLWPANARLGGDSSAETQRPIIRSVSIRKTLSCKRTVIRNGRILSQGPSFTTVPVAMWRIYRCARLEDLKMCSEFRLHRNKADRSWGFLRGDISFEMSLPADVCYESLTAAFLVVRKWRKVLIRFSQSMTGTQEPWCKCNRLTSQRQQSSDLPGLLYSYYLGLIMSFSCCSSSLWAMCDVFIHSRSTNCSIWDKTSHWIIDQVCDEFQELTAACATWLERNGYNGGFQGHNDFQGPGWKEERDAWPYLADENKERTFATFYRLITRLSFIKNLLWRIWGAQPESTDLYSVQSTCFGFKTVLISFVSQDKKVVFFLFSLKTHILKQQFEQL